MFHKAMFLVFRQCISLRVLSEALEMGGSFSLQLRDLLRI